MATKLNERAMLADLTIGFWEGRKRNKDVTEETISAAKAEHDAGAWWTRIIPPATLKAISAAVNKGRQLHAKMTLPWNDVGTRILPAEMFLDYTKALREARAEFERAVDEFLSEYPELVAHAKDRLGTLYVADHYPDASTLRHKFHWSIQIMPLPQSTDFRVNLGDETTAQIRKEIEEQIGGQLRSATSDLWTRLYQVINHVAERLGDPDNIFKNSLIANVAELCGLLPKLNVTGDPNLERMRQEVEKKIAARKPDELRDNVTERKEAADAAKTILDKMAAFMPKE